MSVGKKNMVLISTDHVQGMFSLFVMDSYIIWLAIAIGFTAMFIDRQVMTL